MANTHAFGTVTSLSFKGLEEGSFFFFFRMSMRELIIYFFSYFFFFKGIFAVI